MQVSVENTGGLQRRLTVQVPGQEIQQQVESKLKELSKSVRIKGFRPGRVPLSVVRQRYGKQVRLDIVNETMQRTLQQAIRDKELRPASTPQVDVERVASRATLAVMPTVQPGPTQSTPSDTARGTLCLPEYNSCR